MNFRKFFTLSITCLLLITTSPLIAQNLIDSAKTKRKMQFEGLYKNIMSQLRYPPKALAKGLQGKTTFLFTVENGQIKNLEPTIYIEYLSEEAQNLISSYDKLPQTINGKYSISVSYSISGQENTLLQGQTIIPTDYFN